MKRALFVIENPQVEFALNFICAIGELGRQGRLAPRVLVRDPQGDLRTTLARVGHCLQGENQLTYVGSVPELSAALDQVRAAQRTEQLCFIETSELFFSSLLERHRDLPHVLYDIHILNGMQAFVERAGLGPQDLAALLLERAPRLKVFHIFPGFEYLYRNYGIPASMLAFCHYSFYRPLYQVRPAPLPFAHMAGSRMRDYPLLHEATRDIYVPIRVRAIDPRPLQFLAERGVEVLGDLDYLEFIEETAAAKFVLLPLVQEKHVSCGLSYLAHALALGKAILTTECRSTQGYIQDGLTGLLVPPGEALPLRAAILRLLSDGALRERLERNAAEFARQNMDLVTNLGRMLAPESAPRLGGQVDAPSGRKEQFLTRIAGLRLPGVHRDWLPRRRAARDEQLAALCFPAGRRLLLVNAIKGQQFYPSITDFFGALQRLQPGLRVTCASYFDIHEFHQGVVAKGLEDLPVDELLTWDAARLNVFDRILFVGPSQAMAHAMSVEGLRSALVCLDLAFFHQLLELDSRALSHRVSLWPELRFHNSIALRSCQPEAKILSDIEHYFPRQFLERRWFNYIPIGFDYASFYRSQAKLFDIALLGYAGRDFAALDSDRLAGRKILLMQGANPVSSLGELARRNDVFIAPRVDERVYARLLALSRCVLLPLKSTTRNVLLSVNDALASGLPLVTCRHPGAERILAEDAPLVLYDPDSGTDLFDQLERVLRGGAEIDALAERGVAFAREHLDIYNVLFELAREFARQDG
ncbi:MAG TPA: glycosyltransferase [Myxococcota bacterium]|nr:glycosyltransferase [Myxococcota bacterium]HRY93384.1 glycosyltransferase [Myxococcota bacterium]HSA20372.1 glycosyltransferase [Myxococcota bacterium]